MILLDGKTASAKALELLVPRIAEVSVHLGRPPHLAAILVGNDGASETYVASKVRHCEQYGIKSTLIRFSAETSEATVLDEIELINANHDIDGLIVQLPLPAHMNPDRITMSVSPHKDVDGFHPENLGRMAKGLRSFISATPFGIIKMLELYNIETAGKHCVVLGRSHIVGLPVSLLMQRNTYPGNATVTICHSRTPDVAMHT
ncbi:MAG: tetrahydrofolate dehydrogenase/cyclohydrolase catalytic domain-containing protein, partial [Bacteroidota bacterium]